MKLAAVVIGVAIVASSCSSSQTEAATAPTTTTIEITDEPDTSVASTTTQAPATTDASTTSTTAVTPTSEVVETTTTTTAAPEAEDVEAVVDGVVTGAQRLVANDFAQYAGANVGLIAHQNSVVDGVHLSDWVERSNNVDLVALFGPEHGVRGTADAGIAVSDAIDPATGAPIFSLYGNTRQPTSSMLESIDVLLYDLQDVGTRYYTYISTMGLSMQAAAAADVTFVVLDRPNPLGGQVGGGLLEPSRTSFVGQYSIPDVYGLTSGELARFIVDNDALPGLSNLDLEIVELEGWTHDLVWEDTNLEWIPPSPAITNTDAATLYPATIYFEATNLSYGRGTEVPFQVIGAPWLDAPTIANELNDRNLPGVRFVAEQIQPALLAGITVEPAYLDQTIDAVRLEVTDHRLIRPTEVGIHLMEVVFGAATDAGVDPLSRPGWLDQLSGSTLLRESLTAGTPAESIIEQQNASLQPIIDALDAARIYD